MFENRRVICSLQKKCSRWLDIYTYNLSITIAYFCVIALMATKILAWSRFLFHLVQWCLGHQQYKSKSSNIIGGYKRLHRLNFFIKFSRLKRLVYYSTFVMLSYPHKTSVAETVSTHTMHKKGINEDGRKKGK